MKQPRIKEERHFHIIPAILLILAIVCNITGSAISGRAQVTTWEFGNIFILTACAIIAAKLVKDHQDLASVGFNLFVAAEGFQVATTANADHLDNSMAIAGAFILVPSFFMIGLYSRFNWVARVLCFPTGVIFAAQGYMRLIGTQLSTHSIFNIGAYSSQTFFFAALIFDLLKPGKDDVL